LLVSIKGIKKTMDRLFLPINANPTCTRGKPGDGAGLALLRLLFQLYRREWGTSCGDKMGKKARSFEFVDKIGQIIYKKKLKIHFNDFTMSTSNTLAKNMKKI
jgi:hypothetical protein